MKSNVSTIFLLLFALIANAQISNEGLLAYYPFDGNVLDLGPNNYDGSLASGSFGDDENGNPNAALLLNGVNDFVDLSTFAPIYRENLNKISIYFKVKFDKIDDDQTILSLGNYGESLQTNVFEIEYENNRFQIESETGTEAINHELEIDQQNALFDDQWHQILILLDGDSITYCRDNEEIFKGTYTPNESIASHLFLGCFAGSSDQPCCFFGGFIDELQFYNRLLRKEELMVSNSEIPFLNTATIFPNPANNKVNVSLGKTYGPIDAILIDAEGKSILLKTLENIDQFNINLPLQNGVYFLHLQDRNDRNRNHTYKIIKQ